MNVVPIDSTSNYVNTQSSETSMLDPEEFLNVLLVQLENQNPLEPMNDVEYISQIVQFSMLDGINGMKQEMFQDKAVSYIGKTVVGSIEVGSNNQTQMIDGVVTGVSFIGDKVLLNLENGAMYLENVIEISEWYEKQFY